MSSFIHILAIAAVLSNIVDCADYKFQLGAQSEDAPPAAAAHIGNDEDNLVYNNNNNNNGINSNPLNINDPQASVDVKAQFDRIRRQNNANRANDINNNNNNGGNLKGQSNNKNIRNKINNNNMNNNNDGKSGKLFGIDVNIDPNEKIPSGYSVDWTHFSMQGFWPSLSMIIVSEIGDKTFFIAAILAMKHSRFVVWLGAAGALFIMTILAVVFGSLLQVIPAWMTHYGAGLLFLGFGIKLLWEAKNMKGGEAMEELKEAEEELLEAERKDKETARKKRKQISNGNGHGNNSSDDIELGNVKIDNNNNNRNNNNSNNNDDTSSVDVDTEYKKKMTTGFNLNILLRAFYMTFISEIGDRSQITTVVLAAHRNPWGVTIGASSGHAICTALAVIGGKLLASKISEKNVTLIGGILFLAFSLECFIYGPA